MAKSLLFLSLLLLLSLFVNARVILPENYNESAGNVDPLVTPVEGDAQLLLPSEKQPAEVPNQPVNIMPGNHHVDIRRPYFPRFHHHRDFVSGDGDFFPNKRIEPLGDFEQPPIVSEQFEVGFPDDNRLPMGHMWIHDDGHHHHHHDHDHHHKFKCHSFKKLKRRYKRDHDDSDDDDKKKGGFFKWIGDILHFD